MKKLAISIILILLFFSVSQETKAALYSTYEQCGVALRSGVPEELGDMCRNCIQDYGEWEYPVGESEFGACRKDPALKQEMINRGYTKTSTICNFNDVELCHSLSTRHICLEESPGTGYCYAPPPSTNENPAPLVNLLKFNSVPEVINGVLELMVRIGSILLVFFLVLTGFKFVAAQGNPEAITQAKTALTWVLIGGLLLVAAQALSMVIGAAITSL